MTRSITARTVLVPENCCVCGIVFGLSSDYRQAREDDRAIWYCPNGHSQSYVGETEAERANRLLRAAEARATHLHDQLESERRSAAALRGHLTRARNRIANGVCPVAGCRRHFDNVQAHMATMHPEYKLEETTHDH